MSDAGNYFFLYVRSPLASVNLATVNIITVAFGFYITVNHNRAAARCDLGRKESNLIIQYI